MPVQRTARRAKMKAIPNPALHGIEMPRAALAAFCLCNRVRKLSLSARSSPRVSVPESDIDTLVEFEPSAPVTYLDMARMEGQLSEIPGRKADLRTPQERSRYFRETVARKAVHQYERS